MPRLLYVKGPAEEREPRLDQILGRIEDDDTASYKHFRTPDGLARLVGADLALLLRERFAGLRAPSGVVTFLFVDLYSASGSAEAPHGNTKAIEDDEVMRRAVTSHGGYLFSGLEGTFRAAFAHPVEAVKADRRVA
jgi:hypothetical protein